MNISVNFSWKKIWAIVTAVAWALAYFFFRKSKKESEKANELEKELEKSEVNKTALKENADEVQKIKETKIKMRKKVKEAENDEEVISIVNDVVADNNERVRNNKKNK